MSGSPEALMPKPQSECNHVWTGDGFVHPLTSCSNGCGLRFRDREAARDVR